MFFLSTAKIRSLFAHKSYLKSISRKYERYITIINDDNQPDLTMDVFHEFGIKTLRQLNWYLEKNAEYGGCVDMPWSEKLIIIPFHHDFMNAWLRFDNPYVVDFYDRLYETVKDQYHSRTHFNMKRFDVEEELQLNNWKMPPIDRRMLTAPINGCWDKPELISRFLELQGFKTQRLCCHDGIIMRGHCFTVYSDGIYWRTASSASINLRDKSFEGLCHKVFRLLRHIPIYSDSSKCRLIAFDPPKPGVSARDYINNIKKGKIII